MNANEPWPDLRRFEPEREIPHRSRVWLWLAIAAAIGLALVVRHAWAAGVAPAWPDPAVTPGAIDPAITQANIASTICNSAWSTRAVRPPSRYTSALKRRQLADPRYQDKMPRHFEEDHLVSLELGGAPRDPRNLWPEAYAGPCGARVKDVLEDRLHRLVCAGELPLAAAQAAISSDWVAAYRRYVGPLACGAM